MRLEVESSGDPQVYVDGYYVGTLDDLHGELELEAGPHEIALRAVGHETVTVRVKIVANRLITYRATLKPDYREPEPQKTLGKPETAALASQTATPATSSTIYVIPGCYLGNVPPTPYVVPATCDLNLLVTYQP